MIEGLSIGLLSWKAHETLRRTLESYARARLAANAAEFKVFFNEISDDDRALAAEFGVDSCGSENQVLAKSNWLVRNLLWLADWAIWRVTGR